MGETTLISLSHLMALERKLDVAANNIANIETTGFRAQQLSFQEYLAPQKSGELGAKPERPASMVDGGAAFTTTSAGAIQATGNPLDLAIDGDAYFVIQTDQGERYTRSGSFSLNSAGQLVTLDGRTVLTDRGALTVPPQAGVIQIEADGMVSSKQGPLGRLRLVNFPSSRSLQAVGANRFSSLQAPSDIKIGSVKIIQGAIEKSNVQLTLEMSRLVEITRAYELTAKRLKSSQDASDLNKLANVPE